MKVLTIEEAPFVFTRKVDSASECKMDEEEPCPHYNTTEDSKSVKL